MHAIFLHKPEKETEQVLTDLSGSNVLDIYENIVVIIKKNSVLIRKYRKFVIEILFRRIPRNTQCGFMVIPSELISLLWVLS